MEHVITGIYEKSDFMRLRGKTQQREINELRNTVAPGGTLTGAVRDSFFYFITKMQMVADVPTWLGAYEKATDAGHNEARATALADQAVLDAQGGGQIKDMAGVQRGNSLQKLFTTFYSFFNTAYNLNAESVARTHFNNPREVATLVTDFLLLWTIPAVAGQLLIGALRGDQDDDDDLMAKLVRAQLAYLAGSMVGLRELSGTINNSGSYSGIAGTRFFSEATKLGIQIQQGEADAAFWRSLNNTAGILFHYPAGQVQRMVEGLAAWNSGQAPPQAVLVGPPRN